MNEKLKQIKGKADEIGHEADQWAREQAKKRNMPKWRVWLFVILAAIGAGYLLWAVL